MIDVVTGVKFLGCHLFSCQKIKYKKNMEIKIIYDFEFFFIMMCWHVWYTADFMELNNVQARAIVCLKGLAN